MKSLLQFNYETQISLLLIPIILGSIFPAMCFLMAYDNLYPGTNDYEDALGAIIITGVPLLITFAGIITSFVFYKLNKKKLSVLSIGIPSVMWILVYGYVFLRFVILWFPKHA